MQICNKYLYHAGAFIMEISRCTNAHEREIYLERYFIPKDNTVVYYFESIFVDQIY